MFQKTLDHLHGTICFLKETCFRVLKSNIRLAYCRGRFCWVVSSLSHSKRGINDSIIILDAAELASGPAEETRFMIDLPHDLASDDYGGIIKRP